MGAGTSSPERESASGAASTSDGLGCGTDGERLRRRASCWKRWELDQLATEAVISSGERAGGSSGRRELGARRRSAKLGNAPQGGGAMERAAGRGDLGSPPVAGVRERVGGGGWWRAVGGLAYRRQDLLRGLEAIWRYGMDRG
jgi:hypothetical protein